MIEAKGQFLFRKRTSFSLWHNMGNEPVSQDNFNFTIYAVCGVAVRKSPFLCHCEAHLVRRGNLITAVAKLYEVRQLEGHPNVPNAL